jgi:hypothetical protein
MNKYLEVFSILIVKINSSDRTVIEIHNCIIGLWLTAYAFSADDFNGEKKRLFLIDILAEIRVDTSRVWVLYKNGTITCTL